MPLSTDMTVSDAIQATLEEWPSDHLPEGSDVARGVNEGECAAFARAVARRVDVLLVGDCRLLRRETKSAREPFEAKGCGHVWVTDGSRHYDAECPNGVDDWRDLPCLSA